MTNGDVVSEVAELKQQISGKILVYASYHNVHALLKHDPVDEFRVVVFPVPLGAGQARCRKSLAKHRRWLVRGWRSLAIAQPR